MRAANLGSYRPAGLGRVLDRLALTPGMHVPAALMQDQLAGLSVGPDDKRDLRVDLLDEELGFRFGMKLKSPLPRC